MSAILKSVQFLGLLLCGCLAYANATRGFNVCIQSVDLNIHDHDAIAFADASLVTYKGHRAIHFEFEFEKPICTFTIKLVVHAARQKIVELTTDGCELLRTDAERPALLKVLTQAVYLNSKLPKKCPVPAHERFAVENFYLSPESFPPYTPLMNVYANLSVHEGKKQLVSFLANVEFKKN